MLQLLTATLCLLFALPAAAQTGYPTRNVTLVVPLGAGGGVDITARLLAEGLARKLGRSFVVENRPGAGGATGAESVARAAPDGHTLLMGGNGSHSAAPHLVPNLKYDPLRDFTPIARLATAVGVLVVSQASSIRTVEDLVREAKTGRLSYGAPNSGAQISGETIKRSAGIDLVRVPYRTSPQAMTDTIAGNLSMTFVDAAAALANVREGRLRALAVTSGRRTPLLPDVPTLHESGIKDFDLTYWNGLFGPANLPPDVAATLERAARELMAEPQMQQHLAAIGLDHAYLPAAQTPDFVRTELLRWGGFIRDAGITN